MGVRARTKAAGVDSPSPPRQEDTPVDAVGRWILWIATLEKLTLLATLVLLSKERAIRREWQQLAWRLGLPSDPITPSRRV